MCVDVSDAFNLQIGWTCDIADRERNGRGSSASLLCGHLPIVKMTSQHHLLGAGSRGNDLSTS